MINDDILYQIIGPLLDLPSIINLHLSCKDYKKLYENKIGQIKPYYLNGNRYRNLETLRLKYLNIPDNQKRPYENQPGGTMSWYRIDNSILFLNLSSNISSNTSSHYKYHLSQLGYDMKESDDILDKWFDIIKEGDIIFDGMHYDTILEKSQFTKTQIRTNRGITIISPILQVLIPPRTDILI
jgi:hypothetical protein